MTAFGAAGLLAVAVGPLPAADLLFPTSAGPMYRVRIEAVGRSPDADWAGFLGALFAHVDRDADGKLTPGEAARLFPLPAADGTPTPFAFPDADADGDGAVSPAEFRDHWRRSGFGPVAAAVTPPAADARAGPAVFRHLDRDGDGRLSAAELADAPRLLDRLDADEDEYLTPAEVLVGADGVTAPAAVGVKVAEPTGPADAVLRFGEAGVGIVVFLPPRLRGTLGVRAGVGGLRLPFPGEMPGGKPHTPHPGPYPEGPPQAGREKEAEAIRSAVAVPAGTCAIEAGGSIGLGDARGFLAAQFRAAAGADGKLSREAVDADPALSAVAGLFVPADRDADGTLTDRELDGYLALVDHGVGCRLCVAVADRGRSLFARLDADGDGRLDLRELRSAAGLSRPDGLPADMVPGEVRVVVSRRPAGSAFGPVPLPTVRPRGRPNPKPATGGAVGPEWFRAQDRNADGWVSAAEFVGPPAAFERLDADGDGRLSPSEAGGR